MQGVVKGLHNTKDIQNCLPNIDIAAAFRNQSSMLVYHMCLIW